MKHLLIDVETLGIHEDSVLLQFTALMYKGKGGEDSIEEFLGNCDILDLKLAVDDQVRKGRKIDKDTVRWWKDQPSAVQKLVFVPDPKRDLPLDEAMTRFESWLKDNSFSKKQDTIWQRGDRDTSWLSSAFMTAGWIHEQLPLGWFRVRDLRTAVDVMGASSKLNGYPDNKEELQSLIPDYKQHDSRSDIILESLILRQLGVL
jgi:hypothetical protein